MSQLRPCRRCLTLSRTRSLLPPWPGRTRITHGPSRTQSRSAHTRNHGFAPPSPESLGRPKPARQYRRLRTLARWLLWTGASIGVIYVLDTQFYAASLTRSFRTFRTALIVAVDYKLNFRPDPWVAGSITELHRRNADRVVEHLNASGGLYTKMGQAIASQSAVLPPEFQKKLTAFFDGGSQNDWKDVERVIRDDFGRSPEDVFGISFDGEAGMGVMEKKARAAASIAQVHWARLADGREVAIKIQKREIATQIGWDLATFKIITKLYSRYFDLPLYSFVPYVCERLFLETDFENERRNAERMAEKVASEPSLKDLVYIPKVYSDMSSKRVLTMEWIEGCPLYDKDTITAPWQGGSGRGSPGSEGTPLPPAPLTSHNGSLKPDRLDWKGPDGQGGLGLSAKSVAQMVVDLFSAQIFKFGLVHCDPHWGNVYIRRQRSGRPELVLIDHGLYVELTPELRQQYCSFWKAMMSFDLGTMRQVTGQWGIRAPDLFASATLMRPYDGGDGSTKARITGDLKGATPAKRHFEVQERMRQGIRDVLADEEKFPRELFFVGRNMRIVQTINQHLGSPCNRVRLMGLWASRGLVEDPHLSFGQRLVYRGRHVLFRVFLLGSDVAWWVSHIRQKLGWGGGMEDEIEKQLEFIAKDQLGVELQHGVFDG